jgi:hypothetical protein
MTDHAESFEEAAIDQINGRDFCERGGCELERMSEPYGTAKYVCWACQALWSVRMTALGPAWWRAGTIAATQRGTKQ